MRMTAAITITIILAGLCIPAAEILYSFNRNDTAFRFVVAGVFFSCLAIFLAVLQAARKEKSPQTLSLPLAENEPSRRTHRPKDGERFAFGFYWDSNKNLLCPACDSPTTLSTDKVMHWIDERPLPIPHCLKCDKAFEIYDDDGKFITLAEAKKRLSPKVAESEPKALEAQDTERQPVSETRQLREAIESLRLVRQHLPGDDVEEKYVNIYHQALADIERETSRDVARFRIPESELLTRITSYGAPRIGNRPGGKPTYSKERYCDRAIFLIAIDNAINSLKGDPPTADTQQPAELESAEYQPDETERRILAYLFRDKVDRDLGSIVKVLNFAHSEEAKFHLEQLIKHRYVERPDPVRASNPFPQYKLSQKGREFVIQNNLHREELKAATPEPQSPLNRSEFDPTDIEILKQITKGLVHVTEIARALKLEDGEVGSRIRRMEGQGYVTLKRLENRAPHYQLTDKATEELSKPKPTAPHPTSTLDETSIEILKMLADGKSLPYSDEIARRLRLHPERAIHYLSKLEDEHYVYAIRLLMPNSPTTYKLDNKGREFLINKGLI